MGAFFFDSLLPLLRDPVAGALLVGQSDGKFLVDPSNRHYPILSQRTLCLLPRPDLALPHFHSQWKLLLAKLDGEIDQERALLTKQGGLEPETRKRIDSHRKARLDFKKELTDIFSSLPNHESQTLSPGLAQALESVGLTIPLAQPLLGYPQNLFRDWVWGDAENAVYLKTCLDSLASVGSRPRKILVIAAGAGRLAFDLHTSLQPECTVAFDNSYFFSECFHRIVGGRGLQLTEFPAAPKSDDSHAVTHKISPRAAQSGLHFVLGDLNHMPFAEASFDCVVTPWILDLIPEKLPQLIHNIGALLSAGGTWINFGSFQISPETSPIFQFSRAEIQMLGLRSGLEKVSESAPQVEYLKSPHSAHSRQELLWALTARRNSDKIPALVRAIGQPAWLLDIDLVIPKIEQAEFSEMMHRVPQRVFSLMDGARSLRAIGQEIAREFGMTEDESVASLVGFLSRWSQDARINR